MRTAVDKVGLRDAKRKPFGHLTTSLVERSIDLFGLGSPKRVVHPPAVPTSTNTSADSDRIAASEQHHYSIGGLAKRAPQQPRKRALPRRAFGLLLVSVRRG